jgi:hypothetical protein
MLLQSSPCMIRIASVLICLAIFGHPAMAQQSAQTLSPPSIGGTLPSSAPRTFGSSASSEVLRHRDFTGKPCLEVSGSARAHTVNPNLYDHVISVRNNCPQRIALQVCYYQTHDCIPLEIAGGARKEAILGTLPSTKDFRFEFREKF